MEEAETERVEDNSSLIELDIFWWKLKRKVVKINIFTFLQMSEARHLFIWNKGYNFTRHPTIKAYQASISPCRPQSGHGVLCGEEDYSFSGQTAFIHLLYHIIVCTSLYIHRVGWCHSSIDKNQSKEIPTFVKLYLCTLHGKQKFSLWSLSVSAKVLILVSILLPGRYIGNC